MHLGLLIELGRVSGEWRERARRVWADVPGAERWVGRLYRTATKRETRFGHAGLESVVLLGKRQQPRPNRCSSLFYTLKITRHQLVHSLSSSPHRIYHPSPIALSLRARAVLDPILGAVHLPATAPDPTYPSGYLYLAIALASHSATSMASAIEQFPV
ncbi:hypothetical protein BD309DRAFT_956847 [Dichomitus squalens]|nr:hypothetical protein BD309DRAFT_956847 [Dichomitus squalens]